MENIKTLTDLLEYLASLTEEANNRVDWSALPLFGGDEPKDTELVWSWDVNNLLVGTCRDDLEIVPRDKLDLEISDLAKASAIAGIW